MTHWNQIKGWFEESDAEAYNDLVAKLKPNSKIVEVGSFCGRSAMSIAPACKAAGHIIICIDRFHWPIAEAAKHIPHGILQQLDLPHYQYAFNKNTSEYKDIIFPIKATSVRGSELIKALGISADLVFIDADHTYESVCEDIEAWWPIVNDGGIIGGHDYSEHWPDVIRAVADKFGDRIYNHGSVWWANKS